MKGWVLFVYFSDSIPELLWKWDNKKEGKGINEKGKKEGMKNKKNEKNTEDFDSNHRSFIFNVFSYEPNPVLKWWLDITFFFAIL